MFIFAFEFELQLVVILTALILPLNAALRKFNILSTEAPSLSIFLILLPARQGVEVAVRYLHALRKYFAHVLSLHRFMRTRLTILKL